MSLDNLTLDDISKFPIIRYIHVIVATTWLWDAVISFSTEVEAFIGRRWFHVDFVYIISRILTLCMVVGQIIAAVARMSDNQCNTIVHLISAIGTTTTCLGTYLFLVRARGVFFHSTWAKLAFTALWFIAVGGVLATTPFSFYGGRIEASGLCVVSKVGKIEPVGSLTVAAFDITVFVTISYRVLSMERRLGRWAKIRAFFLGARAGYLSRALLRTGQLYFFPMLVLMISLLTFEFSSIVQGPFVPQCRAVAYCAIAVSYNIMACRVFRLLRLVDPADSWARTADISNLRFRHITKDGNSTISTVSLTLNI